MYARKVHSHLSFFFVGVILIYAISGLTMNHLREINPQYMISVNEYQAEGIYPHTHEYTETEIKGLLKEVDEEDNYTKHYYPNKSTLKVFLKNGTSLMLNTRTGEAVYEAVKKRPILSQLSFLHYNPSLWWTLSSDIFAFSLIIICITGIIMQKGKYGLRGIGGIEIIVGILIPIIFLIIL